MKALLMRQPGEVVVETVPDVIVQAGEVLLKVQMVGLCGSDLNSYRGKNPMVAFPRILGHEVAATIVESFPGNSFLVKGTTVTLSPYSECGLCPACINERANACEFNETMGIQRDGALQEYISIPLEKIYVADLTLKEMCLVEPLTVGFHAVARGRVSADDTVAVFGCGGVGLGAVAASSFRGAKTIAIDVDDSKLEIAKKGGATHTINTLRENLHAKLREYTNGRGPDVVIEAIGLATTFRAAVEEVAFTGRVVYIGYAKEPVAYETRLFVQKELDILGSRNALPRDFQAVIRMLEQCRFPVEDAISTIVPIEEAPEIFQTWCDNPAQFSKIVISME
jgi:threonine dehydrogenase-like Zn-dependent dehydrogenase